MASRNAKKHEQTQWEIKFFEVRRSPDALKTMNHHWGPRVPWPASRAGKPTSQAKVLKVSKLAKVSKVPKMSVGVCRRVQAFASVCRRVQACAGVCRRV